MQPFTASLVLAAEQVSEAKDLYPKLSELIMGAIAFGILFFFMWKWVIPRLNQALEARRRKIQGDLEKAEQSRTEAEKLLEDYRAQLSGARDQANRIIDEARKTAEQLRKDMEAKAEQEYQAIVSRAQEEIRAERDRVFEELKAQVGELSVAIAGKVVGRSLDKDKELSLQLVDDYIKELGATAPRNGHGSARDSEG
jgi:F-type H+-transporting ATPase subunit b